MKKGWLVVNGFLTAKKYQTLYGMLQASAYKKGLELALVRADELSFAVGELPTQGLPDFIIFWDKDVSLARRLSALGVPVFNSPEAVQICDDKITTAEALAWSGVKTPKTVIAPLTFEGVGFSRMQFLDDAERLLGYPMVIKESNGSFGKQVYLAENKKQALKIIKKIGHKRFLMQEFIRESRGRDIRVNVVGGKVICAILRENKRDFRSNVSSGGVAKRVCLTAEQEQIALDACKAVGADFAGVDVLLSKNGALICEVNSNPHFKSTYDCTGVDLSEYITALVAERI